MGIVEVIDRHLCHHGNGRDLSWGWTLLIWLACVISQGNHQKLVVRHWIRKRLNILAALTGQCLAELDFTDDRLTLLLKHLSDKGVWAQIESELSRQTINVYDLKGRTVRVDATTISGHHQEGSLFKFGHSKGDERLRQIKLMLGSLDPLGMPLASIVASGEKADDPLYTPCIAHVSETLKQSGLLFVGDCKLGAFDTRLDIVGRGHHYLCPLALVGQTAVDFSGWVETGIAKEKAHELTLVDGEDERGKSRLIARGYEFKRKHVGVWNEQEVKWTERVLVVRSLAYMETEQASLKARLDKASSALLALTPRPGKGKHQIRTEAELQDKIAGIEARYRVKGLLTCCYERQVTTRLTYVGRGRGSVNRLQKIEEVVRYQVTDVEQNMTAIQEQMDVLGWRVYVTSAAKKALSLETAVLGYRQEFRIERIFNRLKSTLHIEPLWVKRDDQVEGMTHFLILAVRCLSVIEFVVRRSLKTKKAELVGLYPQNPGQKTNQPTAERLLRAFADIRLYIYESGKAELTPLTPLQKEILYHLGLENAAYLVLEKFRKAAPN